MSGGSTGTSHSHWLGPITSWKFSVKEPRSNGLCLVIAFEKLSRVVLLCLNCTSCENRRNPIETSSRKAATTVAHQTILKEQLSRSNTAPSPTKSISMLPHTRASSIVVYSRNSMKCLWFLWPTHCPIQGQWWSIRSTHRPQVEQWCARTGLTTLHLPQKVTCMAIRTSSLSGTALLASLQACLNFLLSSVTLLSSASSNWSRGGWSACPGEVVMAKAQVTSTMSRRRRKGTTRARTEGLLRRRGRMWRREYEKARERMMPQTRARVSRRQIIELMMNFNTDRKDSKWLQKGFIQVNKLLFAYAVLRGLAMYFRPSSQ